MLSLISQTQTPWVAEVLSGSYGGLLRVMRDAKIGETGNTKSLWLPVKGLKPTLWRIHFKERYSRTVHQRAVHVACAEFFKAQCRSSEFVIICRLRSTPVLLLLL